MNEPRIIVYGHNKSELANSAALIHYIEEGVLKNRHRYRYTQHRKADIIVLSLDGFACGHFEISDKTGPDNQDRAEYPRAKCVYIVSKHASYSTPVKLQPLEIRVHRFGVPISVAQFDQIKLRAGHVHELL
jgi:hypothetical protein